MLWENKIINYGVANPSDLIPNKKNAKRHPDSQREALKQNLSVVGWVAPVIVNKRTGNLIDGHLRVEEALNTGCDVPVIYVDISEEEEERVLLEHDSIGAMAKYDQKQLESLLSKVDLDSCQKSLLKSIDKQSNNLVKNLLQKNTTGDDTPITPKKINKTATKKMVTICQEGNITHRIMCGDSSKYEDVKILMGDFEANLVFTDPPYGVDYEKKAETILGRKEKATVTGDEKGFDLQYLIKQAFTNIHTFLRSDGSYYITSPQSGELGLMMMMMMMKETGIECKHCLIWVKDSPVFSMGRLDYDYQHEPILFGWKEKHHRYADGMHNTSVWQIPRPKKSKIHPTMKPVELVENCILNSSKQQDIVLDLFGGSGTTLIAAAKHKRNAYLMEIDEGYYQAILQRYKEWAETNNIQYTIQEQTT